MVMSLVVLLVVLVHLLLVLFVAFVHLLLMLLVALPGFFVMLVMIIIIVIVVIMLMGRACHGAYHETGDSCKFHLHGRAATLIYPVGHFAVHRACHLILKAGKHGHVHHRGVVVMVVVMVARRWRRHVYRFGYKHGRNER